MAEEVDDNNNDSTFGDKERIDYLFKVIGRFDTYINSTNTKASLIIAWNGVIVGTLLLKYDSILSPYADQSSVKTTVIICLTVIGLLCLISNCIIFQVIFPFLQANSSNDSEAKSLIFFGDVSSVSVTKYKDKIIQNPSQLLLEDLSEQAHVLAKGLTSKMNKLQWSIKAIFGELVFIFLIFLIRAFA